MQRVACFALAFAAGPLLLASCGGKAVDRTSTATVSSTATVAPTATQAPTGTPVATSYLVLEVDTSTLAATSSADDAIKAAQDVIRRRAEELGAELSDIERQGTNRLAFEVSGATVEEARDTFGRTGLLEFREPQRDESNNIVCQDPSGQRFTVPSDIVPDPEGAQSADSIVTDAHGDLTLCQGPGDTAPRGSVVWEPASGVVGDDGVKTALTSLFLRPNSKVIFDQLGRPLVQVQFNPEGSQLFDQITSRLVGFPIAILMDEVFISAPVIRAPISDGSAVIEGLTADEGRILSIQINSGPLPLPVAVITAGEGSLP